MRIGWKFPLVIELVLGAFMFGLLIAGFLFVRAIRYGFSAHDRPMAVEAFLANRMRHATIENGIRMTGMPGWGEGTAESAYGSWALVHFVRHLPKLTPKELKR